MPIKICKHCGKEFEARTIRASYCRGECYGAKEREYSRLHSAKFSNERRRAHVIAGCAIAKGDLVHKPCEVCGEDRIFRIVAHHDDYARPLDIRWLCRSCHRRHHVQHGPGKNAFIEPSQTTGEVL